MGHKYSRIKKVIHPRKHSATSQGEYIEKRQKPILDDEFIKYDFSNFDVDKCECFKYLSGYDVDVLMSKTNFSKKEICKIYEEYLKVNPRGELNYQQFVELYSSFRSEDKDKIKEIAEFIFKAFDMDSNGYIDFSEFLIGYALTSKGDLKSRLEVAFNIYDSDHNGYLDANEVEDVIYSMLSLLDEQKSSELAASVTQECMAVLDVNNDGKISKDEFVNGLMKNYHLRMIMNPFQ